jgi:hypothetical protein
VKADLSRKINPIIPMETALSTTWRTVHDHELLPSPTPSPAINRLPYCTESAYSALSAWLAAAAVWR